MPMPDFGAGAVLFAADLQQLSDQIDSLTAPGWTSYTPTLTSSGTQPSLGNGTAAGRWRRAANSDLIVVEGRITLGSTSTIGTGSLYASMPVTASANAVAEPVLGSARIADVSVQFWNAICYLDTSTRVAFVGNSGGVTNTWHAWATGDNLTWFIEYEPA